MTAGNNRCNTWVTRMAAVSQSSSSMSGPVAGQVRVLDGSMGSQLSDQGLVKQGDPLWSARVLVSDISAIEDVHKSYINSAADVVTTCSYQANVDNLQAHLGISASEAEGLIVRSCQAAFAARDHCKRPSVLVAGSVGPYGAAQADLSEYTGAYGESKSVEELVEWHRPRIRCLVSAGCDILAFETIPAAREAAALVRLLREFPGTRAWLSFSTSRDAPHCTARGEPLAEAVRDCLGTDASGQVFAVGVNCCPPQSVEVALRSIGSIQVAFVAYPNSGEVYTPSGWLPDKNGRPLSAYVADWIRLGAEWVGGCCRTGPEDIAAVAKVVKLATP